MAYFENISICTAVKSGMPPPTPPPQKKCLSRNALATKLPGQAQSYWSNHPTGISSGIIHSTMTGSAIIRLAKPPQCKSLKLRSTVCHKAVHSPDIFNSGTVDYLGKSVQSCHHILKMYILIFVQNR